MRIAGIHYSSNHLYKNDGMKLHFSCFQLSVHLKLNGVSTTIRNENFD